MDASYRRADRGCRDLGCEVAAVNYASIFSGMEAAHLAWSPLGWQCVAVAEIDPSACALLGHRLRASQPKYLPAHIPVLIEETGEWSTDPFPRKAYKRLAAFGSPGKVPNFGDVSQITDADIAALGPIDVLIGGSPCQDLSVAGKRAGLTGARSSLFHEQLRIFHAARHLCGARWLVWENVPGAFSSNAGRDFGVVVGSMAGCQLDVPPDGWGSEGVALGDAGLVEWSVLDAQWFGVAQRRRRVFAVLDTGDWAGRPPVLLECDRLRGDSPPRRETSKDVAGTITDATRSRGGYSADDVEVIPEVARCVTKGEAKRQDWETCTIIPATAHTLRADGFDASEDGTGRGTPIIPIAFDCKSSGQSGFGVGEIASTLRSMNHDASHQNGGGHLAVAFAQNQRDEVRMMEVAGALAAEPGAKQQTYLKQGMAVRRLTPRECERLQGAEDDWTLVPNAKRQPMADGPRYKMLGNSFAVPVIRWIGRQIERASSINTISEAA